MNSRILLSAASIAAAGALVVGATFAYFGDSGTSSDNIFSSGTFDMKLTDNNETALDNVSGTWGLASAPGDTFTGDLNIKNTGSVAANHIELAFGNVVTNSVSAPGSTSTTPMDTVLEVTALQWDADADGDFTDPGEDLLATVSAGGNGIKDLDDLENLNVDGSNDFDNLAFTGSQSTNHALHMAGRLHPTLTTNEHQGDSVNTTLTVTMNQDASQ